MLKNKLVFLVIILTVICVLGFEYSAKKKRNPFIPLVTADGILLKIDEEEKGEADIALEGIIFDKNSLSYAILGGAIVRIGDYAGGYQVLKIEPEKVFLIKDGQIKELELKKEEQ